MHADSPVTGDNHSKCVLVSDEPVPVFCQTMLHYVDLVSSRNIFVDILSCEVTFGK
jgi:hypothetical protein